MIRTQSTTLLRLVQPVALAALLSASAGAMAGAFVTSRAGIEYVPPPASPALMANDSAGAQTALASEAADARGSTDYTPASVEAGTLVGKMAGKIESFSSQLHEKREPRPETLAEERDRAGNRYTPATYDSFRAWLDRLSVTSTGGAPVASVDSSRGNRSGIDQEPSAHN